MGTVDKQGVVTMQELLVSALAQTDALTKLLIEKGFITEAEFMKKLSAERAVYQAIRPSLVRSAYVAAPQWTQDSIRVGS